MNTKTFESRFTTAKFGTGENSNPRHHLEKWILADLFLIVWIWSGKGVLTCHNCVFSLWLRLAFIVSVIYIFIGFLLCYFCLVGKKIQDM